MINEAEDAVDKLRRKIESGEYEVTESVERLLSEAEALLDKAKEACLGESFGVAFGEVVAANRAAQKGCANLTGEQGEIRDRPLRDGNGDDGIRPTPFFRRATDATRTGDGAIAPIPFRDLVNCVQVFAPVCGGNGRTYSNSCFARVAGVDIAHEGKCRIDGDADGSSDTSDNANDVNNLDGRIDSSGSTSDGVN